MSSKQDVETEILWSLPLGQDVYIHFADETSLHIFPEGAGYTLVRRKEDESLEDVLLLEEPIVSRVVGRVSQVISEIGTEYKILSDLKGR